VADPSVLVTCTVKAVDDGLLRTSVGRAGPVSSSTLYIDWLNLTKISIGIIIPIKNYTTINTYIA